MGEPLPDIDLNQLPNDEERVIEFEQNASKLEEYPKEIGGSIHFHEYIVVNEFGKEKDDIGGIEFDPFIDQCFLSEEEAFIYYKKYASKNGFSIRIGRSEKRNGEVKRYDFCCQCKRKAPLKLFDPSKEQRNRKSVRCRCKARMRVTLRKYFDIFPREWQITEYVKEHNHELLTPLEVRFLPTNRMIVKEDEDRILLLKEGGLSIRQIMRVMELEKNVNHGDLLFFEKDVRNLFTRIAKKQETNDAEDLLQHYKIAKEENINFQYAFYVSQSEEGSPRLDREILVDKSIGDVHCPPISITKGRPKAKPLKGGKEAGKVTKRCGWCKKVCHNVTTCSEKENNADANELQKKKKKITSSDIGLNPMFSLKY
ncbi:hypothetical protein Vadar_017146 [Vaccinium darrowii]|uniref:Uncharacterized protein n=1 Tax=Vaccinium darrowii TaxID=229202 RepID=A0ACB7YYD1_9ERIC|nr:hypothetical protein Vadar_017146 [Vaccinium darrowii]